eukprot:TRINITY_DN5147_c0_g1_i1.p1 TRINITY_DN5147_c0_g1~~TRINITY_DN5147_c0_g1_i1.p1  ORF type:complete len:314 (+),score=36.96 TRINITY_DN5147_c0_g1_i1:40-942(+)
MQFGLVLAILFGFVAVSLGQITPLFLNAPHEATVREGEYLDFGYSFDLGGENEDVVFRVEGDTGDISLFASTTPEPRQNTFEYNWRSLDGVHDTLYIPRRLATGRKVYVSVFGGADSVFTIRVYSQQVFMPFENLLTPQNIYDSESQFYAFWAATPSSNDVGEYRLNVTFLRGSANVFIGYRNAVPVPESNDFRYAIEDMPADQRSLLMTIEDVLPGWYFIRVIGTAEETSFTMQMFPPGAEIQRPEVPELTPLTLGLIVGASIFVGAIAVSVTIYFSCRAYQKRQLNREVAYHRVRENL